MKRIVAYVLSGVLFFALAAEVGCVKQGLDNRKNEGSVEIALSWDGTKPAGARIHFYPVQDAEEPVALEEGVDESVPEYRVVDCSADGWVGKLPVGTYRVIVYNSDAENIAMRNEQDYDNAELYVVLESETEASALSRAGQHICQPGNLMLTSELEEGLLKVPFNDLVKGTAKPQTRIKSVELSFKVEGAVELLGGVLSGVSSSIQCKTSSCLSDEANDVDFSVEPYAGEEDFNYQAKIAVLDLVKPGSGVVHSVALNLMADGKTYRISVDISDLVADFLKEHGGVIPIEIPVEIPIRLEMIGNVPSVEVLPWDNTGSGSGTIGNTTTVASARVR